MKPTTVDRRPAPSPPGRRGARRGAVAPMMAVVFVVMLTLIAISINTNWILLAQTESQSAADFASFAALQYYTENFESANRLQQSRALGASVLNANTVGGRERDLPPSVVRFGRLANPEVHKSAFIEDNNQVSAVKIIRPPAGSQTVLPMFLSGFVGVDGVPIDAESTTAYEPMDVVLCLDASRSMNNTDSVKRQLHEPPSPGSKWFLLMDTVREFLDTVKRLNPDVRVGLTTFGGGSVKTPKVASPLDETLARREVGIGDVTTNSAAVLGAMDSYVRLPALGWGTSIYDGVGVSLDQLMNEGRPQAKQVIILLSDGMQSKGVERPNPRGQALRAAANDVEINTINYQRKANPVMAEIASTTGGDAFDAVDVDALRKAFDELLKKFKLRLAG